MRRSSCSEREREREERVRLFATVDCGGGDHLMIEHYTKEGVRESLDNILVGLHTGIWNSGLCNGFLGKLDGSITA